MSVFDDAKKEVEEIEAGVTLWQCGGKTYKIPMLNGDIDGQKRFLAVADKYELGASGKPSELALALREFMYELLSLRNNVTEDEAGSIATVPNCSRVYNIWLGNVE